ncbi:MAG: DUF1579 domain-containing protein [Planctomycetes bacterium]|nr:DUF1579 domain-containing protein [Planctomycetota bacterium]
MALTTRYLAPALLLIPTFIGCAQDSKVTVAQQQPPADMQMRLPPGWTEADMMAMMDAATPGPMQAELAQRVGTWKGTTNSWMAPGAPATVSECTMVASPLLDGRYLETKYTGDIPGMGPFSGLGLTGYDNGAQHFVSTWLDTMSTGMMHGTGTRSADGKTITWAFSYYCPVRKGMASMREIETMVDPNTMTLEMYGSDPKSGVEFKMMRLEVKRVN